MNIIFKNNQTIDNCKVNTFEELKNKFSGLFLLPFMERLNKFFIYGFDCVNEKNSLWYNAIGNFIYAFPGTENYRYEFIINLFLERFKNNNYQYNDNLDKRNNYPKISVEDSFETGYDLLEKYGYYGTPACNEYNMNSIEDMQRIFNTNLSENIRISNSKNSLNIEVSLIEVGAADIIENIFIVNTKNIPSDIYLNIKEYEFNDFKLNDFCLYQYNNQTYLIGNYYGGTNHV